MCGNTRGKHAPGMWPPPPPPPSRESASLRPPNKGPGVTESIAFTKSTKYAVM